MGVSVDPLLGGKIIQSQREKLEERKRKVIYKLQDTSYQTKVIEGQTRTSVLSLYPPSPFNPETL